MSEVQVSCWCHGAKRQVNVKGIRFGTRKAGLIEIMDCEHEDYCPKRHAVDCLIGKLREGEMLVSLNRPHPNPPRVSPPSRLPTSTLNR